jgi:ElaB/YqjD/DUF883 family membrane-anchored ribosome-binding protein
MANSSSKQGAAESMGARSREETLSRTESSRSSISEQIGDRASNLIGRAQERASELTHRAQEVAHRAQEAAGDYVDSTGKLIRRYPIQSVLIGLGVGILAGVLLSPRRLS